MRLANANELSAALRDRIYSVSESLNAVSIVILWCKPIYLVWFAVVVLSNSPARCLMKFCTTIRLRCNDCVGCAEAVAAAGKGGVGVFILDELETNILGSSKVNSK